MQDLRLAECVAVFHDLNQVAKILQHLLRVAGMQHDRLAGDRHLCPMRKSGEQLARLVLQVQQDDQDVFRVMCAGDDLQKRCRHAGLAVLAGSDDFDVPLVEAD